MQLARRQSGFTLTELAVVLAIVGLLIGGAMMTLSAQVEQRNNDDTVRRLNAAADAVLAFAIVNKRLPCPALNQGVESFCTSATAAACVGTETTTVQAHGNCSNFYSGFVPAVSIGATPLDANGFAVDAWGNRLRYAVARNNPTGCTSTPPANTRVFTSQANLQTYGVGCRPNDLDVCTTNGCAARAVSTQTAVFIVFSTGKNGAIAASHGVDENENTDGDPTFVNRLPSGADSTLGTFDDHMLVMPVGVVYSKLISAGVLP